MAADIMRLARTIAPNIPPIEVLGVMSEKVAVLVGVDLGVAQGTARPMASALAGKVDNA